MANLDALMTSARTGDADKDEWLTPIWLFDLLNKEFHFNLDPAASYQNTLCDVWYSKDPMEAGDGLKNSWFGNVFVNPPYSQMRQWVKKSFDEAHFNDAVNLVIILIAARTDTRAWWDYIRHGEVRFLKGRLKFDHPNGARYSAPFPSAIVIFRKNILEPKTVYWEVSE